MAGKIFINYRRLLNFKEAQLLEQALQQRFGKSRVFLDTSGIEEGDEWLHKLEAQVDASDAMVALIGHGWAAVPDGNGGRRLDNPDDFVRIEIARAFSRKIPVLPVLIDGASMPDVPELPKNLLPLLFIQAIQFRSGNAEDDSKKIAKRLRKLIKKRRRGRPDIWVAGASAAAGIAAGLAAGITFGPWALLTVFGIIPPGTNEAVRAKLEAASKVEWELEASRKAHLEAEAELRDQAQQLKLPSCSAWEGPLAYGSGISGADFTGAGATFPSPVYTKWAESYKRETLYNKLGYEASGSSAGVIAIRARTVTFGATDSPLTAEEREKFGDLLQWPMVMGGIVPVVNIDGVKSNGLLLDGPTLAKIFLGEIRTWDDDVIKRLNPSAALPSAAITAVHRQDGSGTTASFTDYLAKVSSEWKSKVGAAPSVEWPTGIGAAGNEGVAKQVQETTNSIGYVETAYAKKYKISATRMVNKDGRAVEASAGSVQAAAASAFWQNPGSFYLTIANQSGADSWPISTATFVLMPRRPANPNQAAAALKFFAWTYACGDKIATDLDYVPLPASLKGLVETRWSRVVDSNGNPVLLMK